MFHFRDFCTYCICDRFFWYIFICFWILFNSTVQLAMALEIKNQEDAPWKQMIGASIFGIGFSILIFIYPALGNITITLLLGLYLIGYGVFELHRFITCKQNKEIL